MKTTNLEIMYLVIYSGKQEIYTTTSLDLLVLGDKYLIIMNKVFNSIIVCKYQGIKVLNVEVDKITQMEMTNILYLSNCIF